MRSYCRKITREYTKIFFYLLSCLRLPQANLLPLYPKSYLPFHSFKPSPGLSKLVGKNSPTSHYTVQASTPSLCQTLVGSYPTSKRYACLLLCIYLACVIRGWTPGKYIYFLSAGIWVFLACFIDCSIFIYSCPPAQCLT